MSRKYRNSPLIGISLKLVLAVVLLLGNFGYSFAANRENERTGWSQWRGPNRDGILTVKIHSPCAPEIDSVYKIEYSAARNCLNDLLYLTTGFLPDPCVNDRWSLGMGKVQCAYLGHHPGISKCQIEKPA